MTFAPAAPPPAAPRPIGPSPARPASDSVPSSGPAFAESLTRAAAAMSGSQQAAAAAVGQFARSAAGNLHKTMLTLEKADISLRFLVSVRNKLLDAYREVMRMGM